MDYVLNRRRLPAPHRIPVFLVRVFAFALLALPLWLRLAWLDFALAHIGGDHPGATELIQEREQLHAAMRQGVRATAGVLALQFFSDAWSLC